MDLHSAPSFRAAGYEDVRTNKAYKGGVVRQHGNFSFSCVFQGGHAIAAYEPETVYRIFQRSMFGLDIATGHIKTDSHYSLNGPRSSWHIKNQVLVENRETVCYTYVATDTCTDEQLKASENGTAVIEDFVIISPTRTSLF
jgi:carboxypeptidase D